MKNNDIFDNEGEAGVANSRAFARLPRWLQTSIQAVQFRVQQAIEQKYPGIFRPVSGFRSDAENRRCGGVVGSMHLFGLARDFRSLVPNAPTLSLCSKRFKVILSGPDRKTYHVEVVEDGTT